jgi:hypothetical protein
VSGELLQLRTGTLDWVRRNAGYLDSPAGHQELPVLPRAKAFLQLAVVVRCWALVRPADPGVAEIGALLRNVWSRGELPAAFATDRRYTRAYNLTYCGLAPSTGASCGDVLDRLTAGGYLAATSRSSYTRLEIAYCAGLAGVAHGAGSYRDLYATSLLATRDSALPITDADACTVAHTIFYLSDFGLRTPELDTAEIDRVRRFVVEWTEHYSALAEWDKVAKFVLAQRCLGLDPTGTPSGKEGIRVLAAAQEESGAIPSAAVGLLPDADATATRRFRKAYQTTLMTALMALLARA